MRAREACIPKSLIYENSAPEPAALNGKISGCQLSGVRCAHDRLADAKRLGIDQDESDTRPL